VVTIYALVTDGVPAAKTSMGFALPLGDNITAITPGFTGSMDCMDPLTNASTCDNFAFPSGDFAVNPKGMTDMDAYAPFPNAIILNWATLFVLGLGNLCALDFQVRLCQVEGLSRARCTREHVICWVSELASGCPMLLHMQQQPAEMPFQLMYLQTCQP
jgi:hypothetical protein